MIPIRLPVWMHPDERGDKGAGGLTIEPHGDTVHEEQRSVGAPDDDEVGVRRCVAGHRGREGHLLRHLPPQLAVPVHRVEERALQNHLCLLRLLMATSATAPSLPLALGVCTSGTFDAVHLLSFEHEQVLVPNVMCYHIAEKGLQAWRARLEKRKSGCRFLTTQGRLFCSMVNINLHWRQPQEHFNKSSRSPSQIVQNTFWRSGSGCRLGGNVHLGQREAKGNGVAVRPQEAEPARGVLLEGEEHDVGAVLLAEVWRPGEHLLVGGRPPHHRVVAVRREGDAPVQPAESYSLASNYKIISIAGVS